MNRQYYDKYQKYKAKYMYLKNLIGGGCEEHNAQPEKTCNSGFKFYELTVGDKKYYIYRKDITENIFDELWFDNNSGLITKDNFTVKFFEKDYNAIEVTFTENINHFRIEDNSKERLPTYNDLTNTTKFKYHKLGETEPVSKGRYCGINGVYTLAENPQISLDIQSIPKDAKIKKYFCSNAQKNKLDICKEGLLKRIDTEFTYIKYLNNFAETCAEADTSKEPMSYLLLTTYISAVQELEDNNDLKQKLINLLNKPSLIKANYEENEDNVVNLLDNMNTIVEKLKTNKEDITFDTLVNLSKPTSTQPVPTQPASTPPASTLPASTSKGWGPKLEGTSGDKEQSTFCLKGLENRIKKENNKNINDYLDFYNKSCADKGVKVDNKNYNKLYEVLTLIHKETQENSNSRKILYNLIDLIIKFKSVNMIDYLTKFDENYINRIRTEQKIDEGGPLNDAILKQKSITRFVSLQTSIGETPVDITTWNATGAGKRKTNLKKQSNFIKNLFIKL